MVTLGASWTENGMRRFVESIPPMEDIAHPRRRSVKWRCTDGRKVRARKALEDGLTIPDGEPGAITGESDRITVPGGVWMFSKSEHAHLALQWTEVLLRGHVLPSKPPGGPIVFATAHLGCAFLKHAEPGMCERPEYVDGLLEAARDTLCGGIDAPFTYVGIRMQPGVPNIMRLYEPHMI